MKPFSPALSATLNAIRLGAFSSVMGLNGETVFITPEVFYNNNRVKNGKQLPNGIEIRFGNNMPDDATRDQLKAAGFNWSGKQQMWYAFEKDITKEFITTFSEKLVEAIPLKERDPDVNWFWAKVKSYEDYEKLPESTTLKHDGQIGKGKKLGTLLKRQISEGKVYFQRFYEKKANANEPGSNEPASNEPGTSEPASNVPGSSEPTNEPTSNKPSVVNNNANNDLAIAAKLRDLARSLDKPIQDKLNPAIGQQRRTARRVRIASSMRADGERLLSIQSVLDVLADAYEFGKPISDTLRKFRTKVDVEAFVDNLNSLKKTKNSIYVYPRLKDLGITSASEIISLHEELSKLGDNSTNKQSLVSTNEIRIQQAKVDQLTDNLVGRKIAGFFPTPPELIKTVLDLSDLQSEDKLAILEPTSGKGDIVFSLLQDNPYNQISKTIDSVELNKDLANLQTERLLLYSYLREDNRSKYWTDPNSVNIYHEDFFSFAERKYNNRFTENLYDRIIMNPPFENGQDVNMVTRAYELLKEDGILVAIMSNGSFTRSIKRDKNFQNWVNTLIANGVASTMVLDNQFNTVSSFVQTGVNVRILRIKKTYDFTLFFPSEYLSLYQKWAERNGINSINILTNLAQSNLKAQATLQQDEDLEILQLEAEAEIEILKLQNELLELKLKNQE